MLRKFLFSPDPAEGTPAPAPASGEKPPVAAIALNSDASEKDAQDIVRLKRELADSETARAKLEKEKKNVENRVNDLEDENRQLKALPKPAASPKKDWSWLSGI